MIFNSLDIFLWEKPHIFVCFYVLMWSLKWLSKCLKITKGYDSQYLHYLMTLNSLSCSLFRVMLKSYVPYLSGRQMGGSTSVARMNLSGCLNWYLHCCNATWKCYVSTMNTCRWHYGLLLWKLFSYCLHKHELQRSSRFLQYTEELADFCKTNLKSAVCFIIN